MISHIIVRMKIYICSFAKTSETKPYRSKAAGQTPQQPSIRTPKKLQ